MSFFEIVKMAGPLILMIFLLGGTLFLVKKYLVPARNTQKGGYKIDILSTVPLMPKKYITMVKIENKVLILGVSENSVNLLKEMDYDDSLKDNNNEIAAPPDFMKILKGYFGKQQ